jgi:hypothetical protein
MKFFTFGKHIVFSAEGGKVIDVSDEEMNEQGDDNDDDDDDFKPSAKIRTPILGQVSC